jgi:MoxR-like ATPase
MELRVGYPTREEEERIVTATTGVEEGRVTPVLDAARLTADAAARAPPPRPAHGGVARRAPRALDPPGRGRRDADVKRYVSFGAARAPRRRSSSRPRRAPRSTAARCPDLDDLRAVSLPVLRHRLVLNFQAEADGVGAERLVALDRGRAP